MDRDDRGILVPVPGYLTRKVATMEEITHPSMPKVTVLEWETLLDSSSIHPDHWVKMVNNIADNYDAYDGFVVIHGTDTMAYSASALSFMLENLNKTVVFTGAMIPIGEVYSDAKQNLVSAILCATALDIPEVVLCFGRTVLRGNRSTKHSSEDNSAFSSFNFPSLATLGVHVTMDRTLFLPKPTPTPSTLTVSRNLVTNIAVIHLVPGFHDGMLKSFATGSQEPRGLVLLLYGTGNAPNAHGDLLATLACAIENNCEVVVASQCSVGVVSLCAYATGFQLSQVGVINGHDMTIEAIVTKLAYLMGKGFSKYELKMEMERDIKGELDLGSDKFTEYYAREAASEMKLNTHF